jgi:hypothetical protein
MPELVDLMQQLSRNREIQNGVNHKQITEQDSSKIPLFLGTAQYPSAEMVPFTVLLPLTVPLLQPILVYIPLVGHWGYVGENVARVEIIDEFATEYPTV